MHRDIKPENVFFHDGVLKVADFGFAKMIDESLKNIKIHHSLMGTPLYMAPQILNEEPYTSKCDVWSTGVLLDECIFGEVRWDGKSISNLYKNIKTQKLKFPAPIAYETKDLLTQMLQVDEVKRISWKEIKNHPAVELMGILWEEKQEEKLKKLKVIPAPATLETNTQNIAAARSMGIIQQDPQLARTPLIISPQATVTDDIFLQQQQRNPEPPEYIQIEITEIKLRVPDRQFGKEKS